MRHRLLTTCALLALLTPAAACVKPPGEGAQAAPAAKQTRTIPPLEINGVSLGHDVAWFKLQLEQIPQDKYVRWSEPDVTGETDFGIPAAEMKGLGGTYYLLNGEVVGYYFKLDETTEEYQARCTILTTNYGRGDTLPPVFAQGHPFFMNYKAPGANEINTIWGDARGDDKTVLQTMHYPRFNMSHYLLVKLDKYMEYQRLAKENPPVGSSFDYRKPKEPIQPEAASERCDQARISCAQCSA